MVDVPAQASVPEIWYKSQRVLRTIVASLVTLIPLVNGVAFAAVDYLNRQTEAEIPPVVFVWLNAVIVVTGLIMGLVTRIMAVPGVNDWLTKVGLGSVPKSALTTTQVNRAGDVQVVVEPDPKVFPNH